MVEFKRKVPITLVKQFVEDIKVSEDVPIMERLRYPLVRERLCCGVRIQDLKPDKYVDALSIIKAYYFTDEPMFQAVGTTDDEFSQEEFLDLVSYWLRDTQSLGAVLEGTNTLVGIIVARTIEKNSRLRTMSRVSVSEKSSSNTRIPVAASSFGCLFDGDEYYCDSDFVVGEDDSRTNVSTLSDEFRATVEETVKESFDHVSTDQQSVRKCQKADMNEYQFSFHTGSLRSSTRAKEGTQNSPASSVIETRGGSEKSYGLQNRLDDNTQVNEELDNFIRKSSIISIKTPTTTYGSMAGTAPEGDQTEDEVVKPSTSIKAEQEPTQDTKSIIAMFDDPLPVYLGEALCKIQELRMHMSKEYDLYTMYDVDSYHRVYLWLVIPQYRNLGIGKALLRCVIDQAKNMNVPLVCGQFTSKVAQNIANKMGFEIAAEMFYSAWVKDEVEVFQEMTMGNHSLAVMATRVDSAVPQKPKTKQQAEKHSSQYSSSFGL